MADIVGYTTMMQNNEQLALQSLRRYEESIKNNAKKYQGEIIKSYGDGCLVLFSSAVHAVQCAIDIQKSLNQAPTIPLRIGVHVGEIVRKGNDVFGNGINVASRIESIGVSNSILVSADVYHQIKNHPELITKKIGNFSFKNVTRDIEIFSIANEGLNVPDAKAMRGKGHLISSPSDFSPTLVITFTIIALLVAFAMWYFNYYNTTNQENLSINEFTHGIQKIAVTPLKNLNKNDELEYFSDGVTQEIIDELAKVNQFQISAFSSTVIYKNTDKSNKEIASELDVSLILTGSSRIFGDSVRLSIELVNPQSSSRIWNKTYDDVLSNTVTIQSDIAKLVVKELNIKLRPEDEARLNKVNTTNSIAFDLLLQAKSAYVSLEKEGFLKSIDLLEQAINLDPNYSQAYVLLAWVHLLNGFAEIMGDADRSAHVVAIVNPLIQKALSLDSTNADIYLIMGNRDLFYLNDLPSAIAHVNYALDLNSWPKVPTNYCICTVISSYTALGDLEKATELVRLSKKIDPSNVFVFSDEGVVQLLKGEKEQAKYSFRQAVEYLDIPYFNYNLGWVYYHLEDYENALYYLTKATSDEEDPLGNALAFLSNTYFKLGNAKRSRHFRDMILERQTTGNPNLNIPLAMISSARNNTSEALQYLKAAYAEKEFGFAWYLNVDPIFETLRDNQVFRELNGKVGFNQ